jgi:hypothetical protein
MQVQSHSNSYNQAPRSSGSDRKSAEAEAGAVATRSRREDAITGSQAVLSNSLADALWAIQQSSSIDDHASVRSLEDIYRAYDA